MELLLVDGQLVIRPLAKEPPSLGELLRGVNDRNLHPEWDTGPAAGREAW